MKTYLKFRKQLRRRGIAILAALVFVAIFSALSVGMLSLSTSNVRIADNHHKSNLARSCAESGLDYVRYWMSGVSIPGSLAAGERFDYLVGELETDLNSNDVYYQNLLDSTGSFTVGAQDNPIALNQTMGQSFYATMDSLGADGIRVRVTGKAGEFERTLEGRFSYGTRKGSIFDYGVATKGPLTLSGNVQLDGQVSVDSDVYIESTGVNQALSIIGNSQIAGEVKIVNPDAYAILQGGQAGIGGETGQSAIDNHVQVGVPAADFPYPNTQYFEQYVDGITITSENKDSYSSNATLENARIAANTNPSFSGNVTIKGVLFIEYPNQVTFTGNSTITGIVVGDGDWNDNSGTSTIDFQGTVDSRSVTDLPAEQYGSLTDEKWTFLMAPGFAASFGGNFDTVNGCIAANGIEFYGNAGGTIEGSVINYSPVAMTLSGNSDLFFNRSGIDKLPAGFMPEVFIQYNPAYYSEKP